MTRILVTGGAGYLGSHTCVALIDAGYKPVIFDSLVNSNAVVADRIKAITGRMPELRKADLRDRTALAKVFHDHEFDAVFHFAGLKSVRESTIDPAHYFDVNVGGTLCLLEAMERAKVSTLIFSSSATVYGEPDQSPVSETAPLRPANPYGHSKRMVEDILRQLHDAHPQWRIACLRYFNPAGAHRSGLVGEDRAHSPNLLPRIAAAACDGKPVNVFGNDWPTRDGTGLRDYLHVEDLVAGHLAACERLRRDPTMLTVNLGGGAGASVTELIAAFEHASGKQIPRRIQPRRAGDVAAYWADIGLAAELLGWRAKLGLDEICASAWRWHEMNPDGYRGREQTS